MPPHALERVAEDDTAPDAREVEGFHAEMIPGAHQAAALRVPDRQGEVAEKMFRKVFTPRVVGVQDQLGVGGRRRDVASSRVELRAQLALSIDARVGDDPRRSVQGGRLALEARLRGGRSEERRVGKECRL